VGASVFRGVGVSIGRSVGLFAVGVVGGAMMKTGCPAGFVRVGAGKGGVKVGMGTHPFPGIS
jgi:hypothetical protein